VFVILHDGTSLKYGWDGELRKQQFNGEDSVIEERYFLDRPPAE
jgi:hypothetical protein